PRCKTLNQITLSATEHPTKARGYVRGEQHITTTAR
ncbi:hypothetical protein ACX1IU_10180, partial [Yersinia enterocolitica]